VYDAAACFRDLRGWHMRVDEYSSDCVSVLVISVGLELRYIPNAFDTCCSSLKIIRPGSPDLPSLPRELLALIQGGAIGSELYSVVIIGGRAASIDGPSVLAVCTTSGFALA